MTLHDAGGERDLHRRYSQSPTTAYQALAAGVGWTAAFNLLKNHDQNSSVQVGLLVAPAEIRGIVSMCWLMQKR